MLNEQSNKSLGLGTTELIANFFVNAIASEKRFCPLIFYSVARSSSAISTQVYYNLD